MDDADLMASMFNENFWLEVFGAVATIVLAEILIIVLLYLFVYVLGNAQHKAQIKTMRSNALGVLKGNWGAAIGVSVLYVILMSWVGLFVLPIYIGFCFFYLELSKGRVGFENLFSGFNHYFRNTGLFLLIVLFTYLWSFLLVIPGIIKLLAYSQSGFIRSENPELSALKTISLSRAMMNGNKLKLFRLSLSFLPWYLLCIPTFGLILIYAGPYIMSSYTEFYKMVKAEYEGTQAAISA